MPMPQKPKIEKDTAERWLLTYADLMNLLLIFFIVLYAMSQVDAAKFNQLAQSLNMSLGNSSLAPYIDKTAQGGTTLIPLPATAPSSVVPANVGDQQVIDGVEKAVKEVVKEKGLDSEISVTVQERGVVISINARLLFKSGSADLEPNSKPTIGDIGDILLKVKGKQIKIEGHTDNDAMNSTQFPSNWELSSARATNVLRLLVDKSHVDPTTISAVGYGEFRPLVPNTSEENKAKNRRVDIVILRSEFDSGEAGVSKPTASSESQTASDTTSNTTTQSTTNNTAKAPIATSNNVIKRPQAPAVKPTEATNVQRPTVASTQPAKTAAPSEQTPAETTAQDQPAETAADTNQPTDAPQ